MFVGILLRDLVRDFGVEFENLRHRKISKSVRAQMKTIGSHLKSEQYFCTLDFCIFNLRQPNLFV